MTSQLLECRSAKRSWDCPKGAEVTCLYVLQAERQAELINKIGNQVGFKLYGISS
jgi:hypothetical protein